MFQSLAKIWRNSLKSRITLFSISIIFVSIWALLFVSSKILQNKMLDLLFVQLSTTATYVAGVANEDLVNHTKILETFATEISPTLIRNNKDQLQTILEKRLSLAINFNAGVIVLNTEGTVIADSMPHFARRGNNYAAISHIASTLKEGKTEIGTPQLNKEMVPEFGIAVPVLNDKGKTIGAIAGIIHLNKPNFLDSITENHYGQTGGYLLVAPKIRTVITATDKKRIMLALPAKGINPEIDKNIDGFERATVLMSHMGM